MLAVAIVGRAASETIEEFKRRTLDKVGNVRCPDHNQAPRLNFRGATLRDVSIQMSACCEKLAELANQKIAEPVGSTAPENAIRPLPCAHPDECASTVVAAR